jgi:hypothetical protein
VINCNCWLEQLHECLFDGEKCLECLIGKPYPSTDLNKRYEEYKRDKLKEIAKRAEYNIKESYTYIGASYYANCSFCQGMIRGRKDHKEALGRNKVSF